MPRPPKVPLADAQHEERKRQAFIDIELPRELIAQFFGSSPNRQRTPSGPTEKTNEPRKERKAELPTKAHEERREHWAVVRFKGLTKDGTVATRVETSFATSGEAELYAKGKPVYVWHEPLAHEPRKNERLSGEPKPGTDLARHRDYLLWRKETQGPYASFGSWFDRGGKPRAGQKVRVTAVTDYQLEPRDDRISPTYRSLEAGEPAEPLYVVVTPHKTRTGIGVVQHVTTDRAEASRVKKHINEFVYSRLQSNDQALWETATLSTGPEGRAAQSEVARSFVRGRTRADLIRQTDADGKTHHMVVLTRPVRDPDGKIRMQGTVHDPDDLRAIYRAVMRLKARDREREARETKQPAKEQTEEERPADKKPERKEPAMKISSPEKRPGAGEHQYWIAGVWHGAKRPDKDQWLWFVKGETDVDKRAMVPVRGEVKTPETGQPMHYVLAKIVTQGNANPGFGTAVVVGSTKNKDYAVSQAEHRERKAQSLKRDIERQPPIRRRDLAQEYGISLGM